MTLYVVTQPDPPPGEDFAFVVPGRYLYDVTGITATLSTGGVPTLTMTDSSPNMLDGIYAHIPEAAPPIVGTTAATRMGDGIGTVATVTDSIIDWTGDFSIEFWLRDITASNQVGVWAQHDVGMSPVGDIRFEVASDGTCFCTGALGPTGGWIWVSAPGTFPQDGMKHQVVFTYNVATTTFSLYVDGVAEVIDNTFGTFTAGSVINTVGVGGQPGGSAVTIPSDFAMIALYGHELAPSQIATHYLDRFDSGFYIASVLGDAPGGFYELADQGGIGGGRQPSLIVDNNTTDLEVIPTGFPAVTTNGPYEYSWQPGLNADTQSTDGTLTTVAIPQLLLPAGYTVGVRTLDLQPQDQWSNVTLWWDDGHQNATDPTNNYLFPGPVKLVYQQNGTAP